MQRLSPGTLILGIFAVLLGLVGAYAAKKHMQGTAQAAPREQPKEATYRVPLAVMDLPAGRTIAVGDVMVQTMTQREYATAKLPAMWMEKTPQIIGRTLREPVKQGRAFEPTAFYPTGIGPNVAERLQPGEYAMAIPFDGTAAQAALITPAAMVDVLFRTHSDEKQKRPDATVTLLSRVRVLAVGQSTQEGAAGGPASTVTLAVNQMQARALKAVEGAGNLMLVLRNSKDVTPAEKLAPTTLPSLLGFKEPEKPFVTQVFRRGQLTTVTFEDGRQQSVVSDPPYGLPVAGAPQPAQPPVTDTALAGAATPAVAVAELPRSSEQGKVRASARGRSPRSSTAGTR